MNTAHSTHTTSLHCPTEPPLSPTRTLLSAQDVMQSNVSTKSDPAVFSPDSSVTAEPLHFNICTSETLQRRKQVCSCHATRLLGTEVLGVQIAASGSLLFGATDLQSSPCCFKVTMKQHFRRVLTLQCFHFRDFFSHLATWGQWKQVVNTHIFTFKLICCLFTHPADGWRNTVIIEDFWNFFSENSSLLKPWGP